MRLIDADKLIKWADDSVSQYGGTYSTDMLNMFGLFKHIIDNAPTVCGNNPKWCESCISKGKCQATRPQGKWIWQTDFDGFTYWKCSNCNKKNEMQLFDFCPNCGAEMVGGSEVKK